MRGGMQVALKRVSIHADVKRTSEKPEIHVP